MEKSRGFFTGRLKRLHGSVSMANQEQISPIGIVLGKKGKDRPTQSGREKKGAWGFQGSRIFYDRTSHK